MAIPRWVVRHDTPVTITVHRYEGVNHPGAKQPRFLRWRWRVTAIGAGSFEGADRVHDVEIDNGWAGSKRRAERQARRCAKRWVEWDDDLTTYTYRKEG